VISGSINATVDYCRGCGGPLPPGWEGLFHPNCLKADKRRRVHEIRKKEQKKFQEWSKRRCPSCGTRLGQRQGSDASQLNSSPDGSEDAEPDSAAAEMIHELKTQIRSPGTSDGHHPHESATLLLPDAEMLTAADFEALLNIDAKTLYRYVQRRLIPFVRIQSNVRFRKCDILEWVDRQSHRP
jgi:predicted DNA-binding transcriptional regulator AlpA